MKAPTRSLLQPPSRMTVLAPLSLTLPSAWPASARTTPPTTVPRSAPGARSCRGPSRPRHREKARDHPVQERLPPGQHLFDLRSSGGGSASIQLLRLRSGYTFAEFQQDAESDSLQGPPPNRPQRRLLRRPARLQARGQPLRGQARGRTVLAHRLRHPTLCAAAGRGSTPAPLPPTDHRIGRLRADATSTTCSRIRDGCRVRGGCGRRTGPTSRTSWT